MSSFWSCSCYRPSSTMFWSWVWVNLSVGWWDSGWLWDLSKYLPQSVSYKVEKILKGSLDSMPSPSRSVKIQIMGRKVCLSCKVKRLLGIVNKLLNTKSLLTSPSNVLPYYLKKTFLPIIWIFTEGERWWDQIQANFLNLFYFSFSKVSLFRCFTVVIIVSTWLRNQSNS